MTSNIRHIFYINLDKRTDRKDDFMAEMEKMNLLPIVERFSAIPHPTIGIVGCTRSHIECLKLAKTREYPNVLIMEDDFEFIMSSDEFEQSLSDIFESGVQFDVCMISFLLNKVQDLENKPYRKVIDGLTASGYIVNAHYYDALIELWEWSVVKLDETNHHWIYGNDQIWKRLQQQDEWICLLKPAGKQRAGFSDCAMRFMDYGG